MFRSVLLMCSCHYSVMQINELNRNVPGVLQSKAAGRGSSIGCASAWYADGRGFDPHVRQNILSSRFGHENISTAILSLPLIQEGQLSVTGERMGTKYW